MLTLRHFSQSISTVALSLILFACSGSISKLLVREQLTAAEAQKLLKTVEDGNVEAQFAMAYYYEN